MQHVIHSALLALHNLALVVCAGAPFYLRLMVLRRERSAGGVPVESDKLLARTIHAALPWFVVFAVILIATGVGMPLNRALNSGALRPMNPVAGTSAMLKLASVAVFLVVMAITFLRVNRPLVRLLDGPTPRDPGLLRALAARRRKLLTGATVLAAAILVLSGFMRFQMC